MRKLNLSGWQQFVLVLVRFVVGWHFFYQGLGKLRAASWSSAGYLKSAWGPFAPAFQWLAENPLLLKIADTTTIWALMILGLLLMLGLLTRTAALAGALLLLSFFLAAPPLPMLGFTMETAQGMELYVDKTLIELLTLVIIFSFPTGQMAGLDILIRQWRMRRRVPAGRNWSSNT